MKNLYIIKPTLMKYHKDVLLTELFAALRYNYPVAHEKMELFTFQFKEKTIDEFYTHVSHMVFYEDMKKLYCSDLAIALVTSDKSEESYKYGKEMIGGRPPRINTLRYKFGNPEKSHDNVFHSSESEEDFNYEYDLISKLRIK